VILIIKGFSDLLRQGRINVIQFDYGLVNILNSMLLRMYYEHLGALGFVIGKIYPTYVDFRDYDLGDEDFRGPNYMAVLRDRADLIHLLS
jgi:hypothetical protein